MSFWLWVVCFLLSLLHMVGALSWALVNKRSGFEALALVLFTAVAWPLFVLRMVFRGYGTFLHDGWPKDFWE